MGKKSRLKKERAIGARRDPMAPKGNIGRVVFDEDGSIRLIVESGETGEFLSEEIIPYKWNDPIWDDEYIPETTYAEVQNVSGTLAEAVFLNSEKRKGQTTEPSTLWSAIGQHINLTDEDYFYIHSVSFGNKRNSQGRITLEANAYENYFFIEKQGDNEFLIDNGASNDELCRIIRRGEKNLIVIQSSSGNPENEETKHFSRAWMISPGRLLGMTYDEVKETCLSYDKEDAEEYYSPKNYLYIATEDIDLSEVS